MNSNSNFNITKTVVDPTSQQLTKVFINGQEYSPENIPSEYKAYYVTYVSNVNGSNVFAFKVKDNGIDTDAGILIPFGEGWKHYDVVITYLGNYYTVTVGAETYEVASFTGKTLISDDDITEA